MKKSELTPKQVSSVPCPTVASRPGSVVNCIQALLAHNHTRIGSLLLWKPSKRNDKSIW